ncbi:MAG: histidine kinase [Burkholderiales bacterium]|nr:histidine kinase [Burkholderiales bacterium]
MSASAPSSPGSTRPAIVEWVLRLNTQVSGWAASMTWWRLLILGIVILVAASIVSEQLNLRHDRVKVPVSASKEPVVVTFGGKDGIRITRPRKGASDPADATPTPAQPPSADPAEAGKRRIEIRAEDDDEDAFTYQSVFTFRGLLGDLGATLLTLLFAYLIAAKVIVRKVALADEKVRSAVSHAEREAMERQVAQARLQVLQAQVEPHFLFNTLAAVDYLIETDPARASQMQKKLITYLRGALPQMREETSTLGREVRLVSSYLDLIKMRVEERLEVEIAVPQPLESAQFPPLMLQSLVENAIKHGIEPKPEGGKVTVAAKVIGSQLWVEVRDTGVGIVDPEQLEAPTSGTGIGLQNIRERLAMLFPGKGRLTLMSDDRLGTVVRIGVPYQVGDTSKVAPQQQPQREQAA